MTTGCKNKIKWLYIKNTYLLSFGPFFVFAGLHWPSLAAVGLPGLRSNKKIIYGMMTGCKNKIKWLYMKNTYLSSFGPFFIFVGLRWPSLAAVGLPGLRSNKKIIYGMTTGCKNKIKWLYMKNTYLSLFGPFFVFVGLCWPSLTAVGLCGPALAFVGRRWLLLM